MPTAAQASDPKPVPEVPPAPLQRLGTALLSRAFERTPTLHNLLFYLLEHRNEELSEYRIATEALGRKSDFESHSDSTVRVQISRLRSRLKKFYETEGSQQSTRIIIPLGTHRVQLVEVDLQDNAEKNPSPSDGIELVGSHPQPRRQNLWIYLVLGLVIILSNGGWMLWMRQHTRQEGARNQQHPLPAFWQQFLGNGKRTLVVFPNPVFFLWGDHLVARDWRVTDLSKVSSSENLAPLEKRYGKPLMVQYYADSYDVSASWRLARFLDPMGTQIELKGTAAFPGSALDWDNNLIAIGSPFTFSTPFQSFLDRLSFQLDMHESDLKKYVVTDRHPAPGAPVRFESVQESPSKRSAPSIIALLPGGTRDTHILLGVTAFGSSIVAYLLSESGQKELEKAQAEHGHCRYFEAVIITETNGDTELGSKLVEFKALQ